MDVSQGPNYVPRFRNIVNLRDLGGEATPDGRTMRRGLIYRSGALYLLNESERAELAKLGLRYVLDLRTNKEVHRHPDPPLEGVEQVHISAAKNPLNGSDLVLSGAGLLSVLLQARWREPYRSMPLMDTMGTLYGSAMAFDNPAYRDLFHQLEKGNVPLLFHCSQGKDRTGVAAMLVKLALGFSEEAVVDAYVLSNQYRAEKISALIDGHPRLMSRFPQLRFVAQAGEGVIRDFGEKTIDVIRQRYGSLDAYFEQEYGLTAKRREALQELYLELPGD